MTHDEHNGTRPVLPFSGERFTPECVREIWYEHWHRYAFCVGLAPGRRVLDAACGEGYGSAMLADAGAKSVVGVDVDAETIGHARRRYHDRSNLGFECASVTALPLSDASIDLIVSFETIEHLAEQDRMLDEFLRVLAPGGVLVISSPDRENYNAGATEPNPYHVRELSAAEFEALLAERFPARRLFGQRLAFQSLIWARASTGAPATAPVLRMDPSAGRVLVDPNLDPIYHLAVCARSEDDLHEPAALSLFADIGDSVYAHYNQEVRRVIACDHRIHELEREVADLRAQLTGARS